MKRMTKWSVSVALLLVLMVAAPAGAAYKVLVDHLLTLPDDVPGYCGWGLPTSTSTPMKGAEEMLKMLMYHINWTSPDYEHGQIWMRVDVIQQPTTRDYQCVNILDEGGPGHHWSSGYNGGTTLNISGTPDIYLASFRMTTMGQLGSVGTLVDRMNPAPALAASPLMRDWARSDPVHGTDYLNVPWNDPLYYPATLRVTWVAMDNDDYSGAVQPPWEEIVGVTRPKIRPLGYSYVASYSGSVIVTMTPRSSGSTIRYTTNGSEPTTSSTLYTAPFTLTSDTTVKAKAFKSGLTASDTSFMVYKITGGGPTPAIATSTTDINVTARLRTRLRPRRSRSGTAGKAHCSTMSSRTPVKDCSPKMTNPECTLKITRAGGDCDSH